MHPPYRRESRQEGPRPRWLSAAGGVSVAYAFVHLLPELAEAQARWLEAMPDRPLTWLDRQVYLTALLGLVFALAVDRAGSRPGRLSFRLHIGSFATGDCPSAAGAGCWRPRSRPAGWSRSYGARR